MGNGTSGCCWHAPGVNVFMAVSLFVWWGMATRCCPRATSHTFVSGEEVVWAGLVYVFSFNTTKTFRGGDLCLDPRTQAT